MTRHKTTEKYEQFGQIQQKAHDNMYSYLRYSTLDTLNMMNVNSWKSALTMGGLCAFTLLANGAPLQRADVAANPAWLVHLDCDALRPTIIGKYILSEMDQPEAKAKLAAFQAMVGVDLRTQLHGATLYGLGPAPEQAQLPRRVPSTYLHK